jgi:polyisoprenoid-binding protein YceI
MNNNILSISLILFGVVYLFQTRKEAPQSFGIGLLTLLNLIFIGFLPHLDSFSLPQWMSSFYFPAFTMIALSVVLGWFIVKKNLQILSWAALAFPMLFFLADTPENQDKISAFTYVQIAGLGAVFPLMVHFLSVLISNFAPPKETPIKAHKQLIALLLGLAILGFLVIISNFVLGKDAIYLLAVGIFSTSLMFSGYNLNGQKSFPTLVFLLLGIVLFTQFHEQYRNDLNIGMYQLFSGFLFGMVALFLSAFCSSWAAESDGFFSKILFLKALIGPLVLVFISGFLYFVYEAFGGRLSLSVSLLGAAFSLPIFNQIFENRAYGATGIIFGASLLIMPMLEHDKSGTQRVVQTDQLETNLKKLTYTNDAGEAVETNLNDLSIAQGKWLLDEENSIIEFKVHGEESVTDGFFKGFKGTLVVEEDFSKTYMDIEIPVSIISTFNKTRDKSIRKEDIFFEEEKFPKLNYEVKNLSVENDQYVADGQFTMKGISALVKTNFIFVAKGTLEGREVVILEGSGALNRTEFGQSSDASIGDEVSFTFKAIFSIE